MKITMLETRRGSQDGHTVERLETGETYDIADSLALSFIRDGWAHEAGVSSLFEMVKGIVTAFDASRS